MQAEFEVSAPFLPIPYQRGDATRMRLGPVDARAP